MSSSLRQARHSLEHPPLIVPGNCLHVPREIARKMRAGRLLSVFCIQTAPKEAPRFTRRSRKRSTSTKPCRRPRSASPPRNFHEAVEEWVRQGSFEECGEAVLRVRVEQVDNFPPPGGRDRGPLDLHRLQVSSRPKTKACGSMRIHRAASHTPRGVEQTPLTPPKTPISETERTKSGTPDAKKAPSDPDLALIEKRWPNLPEHIKAAVLALVRVSPAGD